MSHRQKVPPATFFLEKKLKFGFVRIYFSLLALPPRIIQLTKEEDRFQFGLNLVYFQIIKPTQHFFCFCWLAT